jgi:murein DD-endopeptidase MepM/ murein hydrolase activator NlpD
MAARIKDEWTNLFRHRRASFLVVAVFIAIIGSGIGSYQYVQAHQEEYYTVLLGGQAVGDISSKDKVDRLLADEARKLAQANSPVLQELDANQVAFATDKAYKKKIDDEATLKLLASKLTKHPIGVKVIVAGKEIGIVRDQKTAEQLMLKVKRKYVPSYGTQKGSLEVQSLSLDTRASTAKTGKPASKVVSVGFVENVSTEAASLGAAKLSDPNELYETLTKGEPIPRKYTVQDGDCIGCIASKLNVSEDLIYRNNTWIKNDQIKAGDVLDLSESEPPMLTVGSIEQVTEIEAIDAPVEYQKSDDLKAGQTKVIRQGKDGRQQVTYRLIKRNGALIEEAIVAREVLQQPVSTLILRGTKVIRGEGTGKFSWPVSGHSITSYLGKRWGRMHNGIDMVGNRSIMAADNGVVEFAGYKAGGLGNAIIIDHHNGFKTVYGHMRALKVHEGQIVEKGDVIGIMGSTGRSTGTHLHFEVHLNGKLKNPLSYL